MSLLTPIIIGLAHSMETDHVLAVGNLLKSNNKPSSEAIRGASWGLGHTISVMILALFLIYIKDVSLPGGLSFELIVGIMMVIIGSVKIINIFLGKESTKKENPGIVFFNVGVIHGIAGSGAIAALITTEIMELSSRIYFLFMFGIGTMIGMGMISILFTRLKFIQTKYLKFITCLIAASSILYGIKIIIEQLA